MARSWPREPPVSVSSSECPNNNCIYKYRDILPLNKLKQGINTTAGSRLNTPVACEYVALCASELGWHVLLWQAPIRRLHDVTRRHKMATLREVTTPPAGATPRDLTTCRGALCKTLLGVDHSDQLNSLAVHSLATAAGFRWQLVELDDYACTRNRWPAQHTTDGTASLCIHPASMLRPAAIEFERAIL